MTHTLAAVAMAHLVDSRPELQDVAPNATPTTEALASFSRILNRAIKADASLALCTAWKLPVPSKHATRCNHLADYVLRSTYRLALAKRTGLLAETEGRTGRPTHSHSQVLLDDQIRQLLAGELDVIVWTNNGDGFDSGLPLARLHVKSSLKRLGVSVKLAMRRGTPQNGKGNSNTFLPLAYVAQSQEAIEDFLMENA